jgi:hypothetical protein
LRLTPAGRPCGWDMAGAMALARARGIDAAAAELLPAAEMGMLAAVADVTARQESEQAEAEE